LDDRKAIRPVKTGCWFVDGDNLARVPTPPGKSWIFFLENSRTWKVRENHWSWKVLEIRRSWKVLEKYP